MIEIKHLRLTSAHLFGMHATLSPALLAGGVTITLLAAVGLCSALAKRHQ
jgi:hypothetical protein